MANSSRDVASLAEQSLWGTFLGSYSLALSGQKAFARLSGDHNPIHMDPVAARRTLSGGITVHGMHHALLTLEATLKYFRKVSRVPVALDGISAHFLKPVLVADSVDIHLAGKKPDACQVICTVGNEQVVTVALRWGSTSPNKSKSNVSRLPRETLAVATFDELTSAAGEMPVGLDSSLAKKLFPRSLKLLGREHLADLLALTRLVGMRCPGLYSMFGQFDVSWTSGDESGPLHYRVVKSDDRFRRLQIEVSRRQLKGRLSVFVRPAPESQLCTAAIKKSVPAGSFSSSCALIVGGSRGLGEITAKIIAAGGGHPIITYHQGAKDAESVAKDIRDSGGNCSLLKLDVSKEGDQALQRLLNGPLVTRSIYYFATPKIFGPRYSFFDCGKLRSFEDIYVTSFVRLIETVAAATTGPLPVFYPSSIAVEERQRELAEYIIAKQAAESVCAFYNNYSDRIKIIVARLPRTRTDQTSTLLHHPAEEPLKVMLSFVQRTEALIKQE
jgi:hypothetical protein